MPTYMLILLIIGIAGGLVFSLLFEFDKRYRARSIYLILELLCLLSTILPVFQTIRIIFTPPGVGAAPTYKWIMMLGGVAGAVAFGQLYLKRSRGIYIAFVLICCLIAVPGFFEVVLSFKR